MTRETFLLIAVGYYLFTMGTVVIVLVFMNKKYKKNLNDEISKLERDKNLIISSSILSELNKVEALVNNDELKKRYDEWVKRFADIKDVELPKITDEIIDGNTAVVTADVTVYNYGSTLDTANDYLRTHEEEFYKKDSETKEIDTDKFMDYKLDLLEETEDRKTYTIEFTLTKEDKEWKLDNLSDENISKIHGIYME